MSHPTNSSKSAEELPEDWKPTIVYGPSTSVFVGVVPVLFFKQKCSKVWIETDRINWLDSDPKLAELFDVRTLYATLPAVTAPDMSAELEIQRGFNDGLTLAKRFADHRDAALEEAAKLCEETELMWDMETWRTKTKQGMTGLTAHALAAAIRALRSQPKGEAQ